MIYQVIALSVGALVMCSFSPTLGKKIDIAPAKRIFILLFGFAVAILGLKVVARIEHGNWSGFSFFGAHFFIPMGVILGSRIMKASRDATMDMLDISAPSACIGLASHKIACAIIGCCRGMVITQYENGTIVRFPSQLVESGVAFLTMIIFILLIRKDAFRGQLYALYMIVYAIERFILTGLRETTHTIMGLPDGQFWSLISFVLGASYLYIRYLKRNAEREKEKMKTNRSSHKTHR